MRCVNVDGLELRVGEHHSVAPRQFIVPAAAVMREEGVDAANSPVDTLYWMREAELKHGRVAQLAGER